MADIQLRFNKDMLVIGTDPFAELARLGVDTQHDIDIMLLVEPEVFEEAYKLEMFCGVQCMVAPTANLTPARLAHIQMEESAGVLAKAAVEVLAAQKPQHILAELGPCGLPLDKSSKSSLNENKSQYMRAAEVLAVQPVDAIFLNKFAHLSDLKCALMGVAQVCDSPIIASMTFGEGSTTLSGKHTAREVASVMADLGASVCGFSSAQGVESVAETAREMIEASGYLPQLVQFDVQNRGGDLSAFGATGGGFYSEADSMVKAAHVMREAGVQFLRACGKATPAYAGALVAETEGLDVVLTGQRDDI
jgi:5-methyltetrahydrofolate--homocysteine methyltransferase